MSRNRRKSTPPEFPAPETPGAAGAEAGRIGKAESPPAATEQRSRVSERRAAQGDAGGAGEALPGSGAELASGSRTSSVTRHAPFSEPGECEFLGCNVDTLDVGVFVEWGPVWKTLQPEFDKFKAAAYGTEGILWGNGAALFLAGGKAPHYRYHLKFSDFELYVGIQDSPQRQTPNVYVSISAKLLWHCGIRPATDLVRSVIESLGGAVLRMQPSRVDLAADFLIPGGLSFDFLRAHRCPAQLHLNPHLDGDTLETLYIGAKSSPIQLRLYHKSLEIQRNPLKTWIKEIWGEANPVDVWRIEFQLRRTVLREMGVETVDDLITKVAGLWVYLTGSWFSLRVHDNPNPTRRTIHPFWQTVQAVGPKFGPLCAVTRERIESVPDVSRYLAQIFGYLLSAAAILNLENFPTASKWLALNLKLLSQAKDFELELHKRRIKFGQDIREIRDDPSAWEGGA